MNYEKGTKVVLFVWGIYYIFWIVQRIKLLIIGYSPKNIPFFDPFLAYVYPTIVCVALLALIILAYRRKEWAYYGIMIHLIYYFIIFLSLFLEKEWRSIVTQIGFLFYGGFTIFSGVSFYILYRNKKEEILNMLLGGAKGLESILYLWRMIGIVGIVTTLVLFGRYGTSNGHWGAGTTIFLFFPNNYIYDSSLSIIYAFVIFSLPLLSLLVCKKKWSYYGFLLYLIFILFFVICNRLITSADYPFIGIFLIMSIVFILEKRDWAYYGFIIHMVLGIIIVTLEITTVSTWKGAFIIYSLPPLLLSIGMFAISLYLLYKNQGINNVLSS